MEVTVPIRPIIDWWQERNPPHQRLRCTCNAEGLCGSIESLARKVGVSHSTIHRRIRTGHLTIDEADNWAIAVGVHPMAIWTDWDRLKTCKGRNCD